MIVLVPPPCSSQHNVSASAFHSLRQKVLCCGRAAPPRFDTFETAFHFLPCARALVSVAHRQEQQQLRRSQQDGCVISKHHLALIGGPRSHRE